MRSLRFVVPYAVLLLAAIGIASCGGNNNDSPPAGSTTTISGSVFAAPVSGATMTISDGSGAPLAVNVITASDGSYQASIPISAVSGTLRVESSGGTYTDEVTGATTTAGQLAAFVPSGSLGTAGAVHLDPASTIIAGLVAQGKEHAAARTTFLSAFGYAPDYSVMPRNAPYSASSSTVQRLAGLRAMAFSQLTKDLGLDPNGQFALLTAMTEDLNEGELNGDNGAGPVSLGTGTVPEDIKNRFEQALMTCLADTVHNRTGLTVDQVGNLAFAKVALTAAYRIEYVPVGMMGPAMGKSTFKIKITRRSDGTPVTGLLAAGQLKLMPVMHMSTKNHGTPVEIASDNNDGTYTCTAYYLMASGLNMGIWELKVIVGAGMSAETASFYPSVGMAMGIQTIVQRLYGPADIVSSPSGTQYTRYVLFRDGSATASTGTLDLMIAHGESMMMSFVPTSVGSVLSAPTGTVTSMSVTAAMDAAFSIPVAGSDNGGGHWTLSGLTGLVSGQTATIYVKMSVNGQDKTTDGNASAGTNAYTSFVVIPQ